MSLPQRSRSRYNSKFRLKRNPTVSFLGFIGEPPSQVRYDNNPPQMLEVGFGVQDLTGKLIEHCGARKTLYLVGSFLDLMERINYRIYEVTGYFKLTRDIIKIHPVTKQKINGGVYEEMVWVQVEPVETKIEYGKKKEDKRKQERCQRKKFIPFTGDWKALMLWQEEVNKEMKKKNI